MARYRKGQQEVILMKKKIIIIGAGPAGLAAACAAVDNGISSDDILVIERDSEPGGILNQCIHAGFGLKRFVEELTGPEYAGRFIRMANNRKIKILTDSMVLGITADKKVTFVSSELGYVTADADAVILAMGCRERTRGALRIPGSRPSGVYTAGCAQRYMNIDGCMPGKKVVILGSGDIGLIMARRLTLEGAEVKLVCELMPYSSGLARNIEQCLNDFDIPLKLSHTVVSIHGKERLEGVTVAAVDKNLTPIKETEEYIECDTLLLSVGLIPENELTREAGISLDGATNGATVNQFRETETEGIFSCGNVLHVHDVVDFVSDEAETAGRAAADYVLGRLGKSRKTVSVKAGNGVRYTVPERLDLTGEDGETKIFFRVTGVMKKVELIAETANGTVLSRRAKTAVAPGEMETLSIDADSMKMLSESGTDAVAVYVRQIGGDKK